MQPVKLVTLDVTNTVIRVVGGVGYQYSILAKARGIELEPEVINQAFRHAWKEQNKLYPIFGRRDGLTSRQWWDSLVKKTLTGSGMDPRDPDLGSISLQICTHFETEGWMLIPQSVCVLQTLKARNLTVGAVSNFDDTLESVLKRMSLLPYFDFVLPAWKAGYAKPDPEIYHQALDMGKATASETVHVGDDLLNDYLGPRKVGIKSVLYCKDPSDVPTDVECSITNLIDIMKYV